MIEKLSTNYLKMMLLDTAISYGVSTAKAKFIHFGCEEY